MEELLLGDCRDYLKIFVEQEIKVDCVIADIPYNLGKLDWDSGFDLEYLCPLLQKILKPNGNLIIFNGWSNIVETKLTLDKYFTIQNWIIYDRIKGRGAKTNLVSTREDILWYSNGTKSSTFNRVMSNIPKKTKGMGEKNGENNRVLSNVWSDISPIVPWSKERVDHPTQKPVNLMERCINIWTNPNDVVLDFTMGSGSTGVACRNLNRNFIGIEIDSGYFEIAKERLDWK